MKKFYFEPAIEITNFDAEDIVTGSSTTDNSSIERSEIADPTSVENPQVSVSWETIKSNIVF